MSTISDTARHEGITRVQLESRKRMLLEELGSVEFKLARQGQAEAQSFTVAQPNPAGNSPATNASKDETSYEEYVRSELAKKQKEETKEAQIKRKKEIFGVYFDCWGLPEEQGIAVSAEVDNRFKEMMREGLSDDYEEDDFDEYESFEEQPDFNDFIRSGSIVWNLARALNVEDKLIEGLIELKLSGGTVKDYENSHRTHFRALDILHAHARMATNSTDQLLPSIIRPLPLSVYAQSAVARLQRRAYDWMRQLDEDDSDYDYEEDCEDHGIFHSYENDDDGVEEEQNEEGRVGNDGDTLEREDVSDDGRSEVGSTVARPTFSSFINSDSLLWALARALNLEDDLLEGLVQHKINAIHVVVDEDSQKCCNRALTILYAHSEKLANEAADRLRNGEDVSEAARRTKMVDEWIEELEDEADSDYEDEEDEE